MIRFLEPYMSFEDHRGTITGLVNSGEWREINVISTKAGVVRGGHYHKRTEELFIILGGEIEVICEEVSRENHLLCRKESFVARAGDIFIVEPFACHTFTTLTDSRWMNALTCLHNPDEPDMYKPD
jgi:dTDP-4-dehydrorhamnose 3,5-epimerase-like enzyme